MSAKLPINTPYVRAQRQFPQDSPQALGVELDKMYIDLSRATNDRTIGVFPMNQSAVTGESWFLLGSNQKEQGVRQAFTFTSFSSFNHNLNLSEIANFVRIFGTFQDTSGNWYPLPYTSPTAANQVGVSVSSTQIVLSAGAGAPTLSNGICVLEWTANP